MISVVDQKGNQMTTPTWCYGIAGPVFVNDRIRHNGEIGTVVAIMYRPQSQDWTDIQVQMDNGSVAMVPIPLPIDFYN